MEQAVEFYELSKAISIYTKPILFFYGMQRLAKALIFFKNPTIEDTNLRTHGITGGGISSKIENFLESRLHISKKGGIFKEFAKLTTKNRILMKDTFYTANDSHHTLFWLFDFENTKFLESSEFKVRDLLFLIPELLDVLFFFKIENTSLIDCQFSTRQHSDGNLDTLANIEKK